MPVDPQYLAALEHAESHVPAMESTLEAIATRVPELITLLANLKSLLRDEPELLLRVEHARRRLLAAVILLRDDVGGLVTKLRKA